MSEEDFLSKLRSHDWYYNYSDDHRAYCKGRDSYAEISKLANSDPRLMSLLKDYQEKRFASA